MAVQLLSPVLHIFRAVRRHESGAHKVQHVANLYLGSLQCRACLKIYPTKVNLRRHLTAIPRCLAIQRVCFPFGSGAPIPEVAKGLELTRLNTQDPEQALGPLICESLMYIGLKHFDVPHPPCGFALHQKGTEVNRLARVAAATFDKPVARPLSDLVSLPPTLAPQRAFLIAFGGRRRSSDIVDHMQQFVASHSWTVVPVVCVLDLVVGCRSAAVNLEVVDAPLGKRLASRTSLFELAG